MAYEVNDQSSLIDQIKIQLSSLEALITEDGYTLASNQAESELGWSYPMTDPTKAFWIVQRATRHAVNILRIASANKFKYKLVNLQHRFEHFQKMVEVFDAEFEKALDANIALFAGVEDFRLFGTKIDAGFAYDDHGNDLTYNIDRLVNFTPSEND